MAIVQGAFTGLLSPGLVSQLCNAVGITPEEYKAWQEMTEKKTGVSHISLGVQIEPNTFYVADFGEALIPLDLIHG